MGTVKTEIELEAAAAVIRDETTEGGNTRTRVYDWLSDINITMFGNLNTKVEQSNIDAAITALKGGVTTDGDTLAKLRALIAATQSIVASDDINYDTIQEIVDFVKTIDTDGELVAVIDTAVGNTTWKNPATDYWRTFGTTLLTAPATITAYEQLSADAIEVIRLTSNYQNALAGAAHIALDGSKYAYGTNKALLRSYDQTGVNYSEVSAGVNNAFDTPVVYVGINIGGNETSFRIRDNWGVIFRDDIDSIGLSYNADYSVNGIAQRGDRWIPDKGYNDGRYQPIGNFDNYVGWNLKTNGFQRISVVSGGDLDIVAGTDIGVSYSAGGVVTINYTGSGVGGNPAGVDTEIQFNNSGAFGGASNLNWDSTFGGRLNLGITGGQISQLNVQGLSSFSNGYIGLQMYVDAASNSGYLALNNDGVKKISLHAENNVGSQFHSFFDIISLGLGTSNPNQNVKLDIVGTNAITLPKGTTAQRPSTPITSMFRFSTTFNQFEGYTNTGWRNFGFSINKADSAAIGASIDWSIGVFQPKTVATTQNITAITNPKIGAIVLSFTGAGTDVTIATSLIPAERISGAFDSSLTTNFLKIVCYDDVTPEFYAIWETSASVGGAAAIPRAYFEKTSDAASATIITKQDVTNFDASTKWNDPSDKISFVPSTGVLTLGIGVWKVAYKAFYNLATGTTRVLPKIDILENGSTIKDSSVGYLRTNPADISSNGFAYIKVVSGTKTVKLQHYASITTSTVTLKDVKLEVEKAD